MATPVEMQSFKYRAQDARGNVVRVTFKIGGASVTATDSSATTLLGHLNAMSNAHFSRTDFAQIDHTYGTSAEYNTVEDKMALTCVDENGGLHRFQIPAPKSAGFLADQETANLADTNVAAVVTDIQTFVYGFRTATAPLTVVGGIRIRRKLHRKENVFTKSAGLDEPGP